MRCWGANDHGQLGNNSTDDASVPVRPQVADVASLTAGGVHTCALLDDNSVQCWGGNEHGQLGDGGSSDALMPTEVSMPAASMVSAGAYHTCAVTGSNVRCWGRNQGGRPVTVRRSTGALHPDRADLRPSVAAGGYHSCAVSGALGAVLGFEQPGPPGIGSRVGSLRPVLVPDL